MNRGQSALERRVPQGCTGLPPPSLYSYKGWLQNSIVKILQTQNCDKIIFNFAKLEENFMKHEIKNFAIFLQNYKN